MRKKWVKFYEYTILKLNPTHVVAFKSHKGEIVDICWKYDVCAELKVENNLEEEGDSAHLWLFCEEEGWKSEKCASKISSLLKDHGRTKWTFTDVIPSTHILDKADLPNFWDIEAFLFEKHKAFI